MREHRRQFRCTPAGIDLRSSGAKAAVEGISKGEGWSHPVTYLHRNDVRCLFGDRSHLRRRHHGDSEGQLYFECLRLSSSLSLPRLQRPLVMAPSTSHPWLPEAPATRRSRQRRQRNEPAPRVDVECHRHHRGSEHSTTAASSCQRSQERIAKQEAFGDFSLSLSSNRVLVQLSCLVGLQSALQSPLGLPSGHQPTHSQTNTSIARFGYSR